MASLPIKKLAQQPRLTVLPAGAVVPVLLPPTVQADPTLRNPTATLPAVAAALAPMLPAGNAAQQPEKRTRHVSLTSVGADPSEATRDSLNPLSLCLGTRNRSEFGDAPGSAPQIDILVYDGSVRPAGVPGLMVFRDGNFSGPLLPARWVLATATEAFILAYSADPAGYAYTAGDYRRAYVPDAVQEQFFQALFSGALAAPSSVNGDANWAHVNAANVPTAAVVPAQNSLQGNLTSYRTPPSVDAVNVGLALKANTADVAATIQSITTLDASQTAAIAAAQALLSTDGNLITAITSTQTTQGASIATNTQNITTNTAAIALKADKSAIIAAVNNLTTTAVSNITPPTIDAVNGAVNGFALQYIGPPANGNIQIGRAYGTLTVPSDAQYCVFENGANGTLGTAVSQLYIGAATIGTTIGSNTTFVTVGRASSGIVIGANIANASIGASSNGVTIGDNCTAVSVGELNNTVSLGAGVINSVIGTRCSNVTIGASASYLTIGIGCRSITVNPSCASVFIGQGSLNIIVGGATAALKSVGVDLSSFSRSVTVNLGQQQLRLVGCNFFTAPAGNNRTYLSNLLVACTDVTAATNKGAYANATAYNPNDQVTNAGQAYLANSAFTSGASFDPTAWTAYYPPSAAGGATSPATATTAGVVKIGSGITVTADGTISAAASGGTTSPATATTAGIVKAGQNTAVTTDGTLSVAGVYRGVWVANTVFKANDTVLNPSGQLVAAVADFTSGASYTASNWNAVVVGSADTYSVLPYAPSIAIDFNAATVRTLAATGNIAFAASVNVALLKTAERYITNTTGAAITLSFPAGWTFFPGPAPTSLAAGKQAVLTLRSLGTDDSTVKAAYVAQA